MANPFSSYHFINAERIVKSNIHSNQIKEDVMSLLNSMIPLKYLSISNIPDGSSLDRLIVEKLAAKSDVLDLLIHFGYVRNNIGEYVYQLPKTDRERELRQNGVNEFQRFFRDLKSAQKGSLNGFEEFIRNSNRHSSVNDSSAFDEEYVPKRSSIRSNFIPSPLPNQRRIEEGNNATLKTIKSLKESLVTEYDVPPTQSFIRRKIALHVFKQNKPHSIEDGDYLIDRKIRSLKQNDRQTNVPNTDDVYIECLIRSNFNENKALEILRHNRPNLTLPIVQSVSNQSTKISLVDSVEPLKQHWHLLNQYDNSNNFAQQLSHEGDEWKNLKHLIPSIQKLRKKSNDENVDEAFLSKMHRLLYSELSRTIDQQLPVKIETIAAILFELPLESIENLDMATIRDILRSSNNSQFHDNFRTFAMNTLSIMCPICAISYPRTQMETMFLCDHICCLECIKNYYRNNINKIRDNKSLNKLTCFQEAHEITNDTKLDFFIYIEAKLTQWFPDEPEILKTYHDNMFYATRDKQIKKCGNLQCTSYFDVNNNDEIACVYCPHCRFAQCRQCCRKWYPDHSEMECDEYEEWLIDNDIDDLVVQALKFLSATAIVCPNCQTIYEYKAGGCEHFTCDQCKTDFCRMCSALFYLPSKNKCPQVNCKLKDTIHAHCCPNCFRETRIGEINAIVNLLNNHDIDVMEELQKKPISTNNICPVEDCGKPTSALCEHRLCERCYQQFLCSLVWQYEIEPWEIYEDNNLEQMLVKASVTVPANSTREDLIELCEQNLNQLLGKPKKLKKPRD